MPLSTLAPHINQCPIFTGKSIEYGDTEKNRYWSVPLQQLIVCKDRLLMLQNNCRLEMSPTDINRYHKLVYNAYDNIISSLQRIYCLREEQEVFQVIQDKRALSVILEAPHRASGSGNSSASPVFLEQCDFRSFFKSRTSEFSLLGLDKHCLNHIKSFLDFPEPSRLVLALSAEIGQQFRNRQLLDQPLRCGCPEHMREDSAYDEDSDFSAYDIDPDDSDFEEAQQYDYPIYQ